MQIIIADHHAEARKALLAFLSDQPGYTVIGEASDADGLLTLALDNNADVILLEYELPGCSLVEIIDWIHKNYQSTKVIVMSSDPEHARISLTIHADAFISKGEQPQWLLATLEHYARALEDVAEEDGSD